LVECLTDNKNRTLSHLKIVYSKNGGSFAESSSVLWMFARKGMVIASKPENGTVKSLEDMELELIDFGAEDIDADDGTITVMTDAANWTPVRDFLKMNGYSIDSAGLQFVATQKVEVKDEDTAEKVMNFMSLIEEDDDVSEVFSNAEITVLP
jgi:transcriptional/translational regulatory protein YebC/TACO1